MKKRLVSLLLAFSMMLTFLPAGAVSAFAEENIGRRIEDGEPIKQGGTYSLSGNYTKAIEINTSESVIINIADGDVVSFKPDKDAETNVLLDVTNSDLTVNNHGVYNGPTFLCTSTDNAKVTIHGGRYNIESQPRITPCAFAFDAGGSDENPIVVDGVHIEAGADCTGIDAGDLVHAPKVMIKNSTINVLDTEYGGEGAINLEGSKTSVKLENVTAHATNNSTITIGGGNLTIGSGHYTNGGSSVVSIYDNWAADVPTVEINGGEFIGSGSESPTLAVYKTNGTMKIHGGTFTSTKCGQVLGNQAHVTIDGTPEFNSVGGTADAIVNVGVGQMTFNGGIITVSGGSDRAALRADGTTYKNTSKTEINGGEIIGAKYGIRVRNGKPNVILSGDVQFENNGTDIYLNRDKKITIEKTFNHNATIDCADPKDGRQLTTSTAGTDYYQKNLNLTSANKGYLVDYKKTTDGQEYRCFSKKVGVTINGLKSEIKAEDPAEFTVTLDHEGSTGTGILTFGDKNSEIEYKDKTGEYKPMPEGGLKIGLGDGEVEHEFRITPNETGKQTLTAAVKQGENKLATDEKDFVVSEMPILTLKDGVITSVTVPGKNGADPEDITEIVKKNANEDGSFHVPEGATVSVAFDKDAFADSGLKFGHWDITGLDDPNAYQDKESFDFVMPAKAVTLKAMTQDASIEDDEPDIVGPIVIGTTVVVGGAVLGYQAYSLGAEFAGKLLNLPYFPSNRSALAMMLWEDAGKPMPESELLYPDVGQEEQDMDLQHAARWAMENELIPDLNDEGTAPEEMKFFPANPVSKLDVLNAWQKAQELKNN